MDDIIKKYHNEIACDDRVMWLKIKSCWQVVMIIVINLNTLLRVYIC